MIGPDSRLARRSDLLVAELAGEIVFMNVDSGMCYGLDAVGTRIWHMLQQPVFAGDLHRALLDEFDVDFETCWRDLAGLLEELAAEKLVVVVDEVHEPAAQP